MSRLRPYLPLLGLFVIYLAIGSTKVILTTASPYYDPQDETNLHFTENAVQYRYAKMVATGEGIPEVDTHLQHPEGVRAAEELTVTLERVSGTIYRILRALGYDTPFHTYSVYFISFFSSLTVFPLYLAVSRMWGWPAGLIAVCFYAVMPPAWMRSVTSFSREDFTLTFLFAGLVCFGLSQGRTRDRWMPWAAAVALSLAVLSWHISGFVLVIILLYAIGAYALRPEERERIFESVWPIVVMLLVVGIGSDLLRNKWFVVSSTMLVAYGFIFAHIAGERFGLALPVRLGILVAFPAVAHLVLAAGVGENVRAYSHAFEVIYYKLRFFLIKPEDPTLMTHDARGMWSSSFRSPDLDSIWSMFSTLIVVSLAAAVVSIRDLLRGTLPVRERFYLYAFFAFLFGYLCFDRIQVFFVFFAALLAARWLTIAGSRRLVATTALILLVGYEVYNDTRLYITAYRTPGLDRLVEWVRTNTERDDVILAAFQVGPSILTYTDRPVVLHPKFESHIIREKNQKFVEGLYGPPSAFLKLAQEWEADYYVYQASTGLDTSLESPRYVAGYTSTSPNSAVYGFHFAPESIDGFSLVYQDNYYRIFRIGDQPEATPALTYQPIFDIELFTNAPGTMPSDDQIGKVLGQLGNPQTRIQLAEALYADGRYSEAADEYVRQADTRLRDSELQVKTANALQRAGRDHESYHRYLSALRANPNLSIRRFETDNGIVFLDAARLLLENGRMEAGTLWLEKAVARLPDDAEAATNLGMLYTRSGRLDRARQTFERVLQSGREYTPVLLQMGLLEQREANHSRAIEFMERYLERSPGNSPDRAAVRQAIRESQSALNGR